MRSDGIVRHGAESSSHHGVEEVGRPASQIVSKIANDGFGLHLLYNLVSECLGDAELLAVAESVRISVLFQLVALPLRTFRQNHQCVIAGVISAVGSQELYHSIDVKLVFRNAATDGSYVGGIERGVARIATENSENTDTLMRAYGGALSLD